MSKLSFRARALDPSKPLNIHTAEELPDLTEYSAINRAVPQMPSGMEKEEESEHHLQRAICAGLIIPTPEVFVIEKEFYDANYPENYKVPRQLIRMQPLGIEQDIPDYDMDSADEVWINSNERRFELSPLKFEEMMDRLEKSSGQTVITLNEAKALLKQDDEVSVAVYDYWLNKRLTTQHPLILSVKTENRAGSAANNPYIAFRRRTEKMQTRKNRKNDETSYEKMLKLRRNLNRALTILELIKRREKTKREHVHLGIEIFEKRFESRDFNGQMLSEYTNNAIKSSRLAFAPLYGNHYSGQSNQWSNSGSQYHLLGMGNASASAQNNKRGSSDIDAVLGTNRKEKRQYKKRKHKNQREKPPYPVPGSTLDTIASSDEEGPAGTHSNHLNHETEDEGMFSFRRTNSNQYHRPLNNEPGNWPWESRKENGLAHPRYRFSLASIRHPRPRCIGFARRRVGRGGRIILDRVSTNLDEFWANLDYTIFDGGKRILPKTDAQHQQCQQQNGENQEQINQTIINNGIKIEDEDDSSSCVIDLVKTNPTSNNNQSKNLNLTFNTKQLTTECSASGMNINKNIINSDVTINRTAELLSSSSTLNSEQIVIKTEQDETKINFDNCLEIKNRNNSNNLSDSLTGGLENRNMSINSGLISRTHSQGLNTNNLNSTDNNINNDWQSSNAVSNDTLNLSQLPQYSRRYGESIQIDSQTNECDIIEETPIITDNQLYAEMFGDWSHFRPKTPEDNVTFDGMPLDDLPLFAENSLLSVEIQRLSDIEAIVPNVSINNSIIEDEITSTSTNMANNCIDNKFIATPFSLENVIAIEQANVMNTHNNSAITDIDQSNSDSLPELSLSLGENQNSDKVLDNLLEECGIDVSKGFNPNANFWNGVLDETSNIFDVIDDKKLDEIGDDGTTKLSQNRLLHKRKQLLRQQRIGHSLFNVINKHQDENIFREADPNVVVPKTSSEICTTDAYTITTTTANIVDSVNTAINANAHNIIDVKKELDASSEDTSGVNTNSLNTIDSGQIIKIEPNDDMQMTSFASSMVNDDHMPQIKPQILPVIKTEVVNSLPVTNATIQRSVTMQAAQFQPNQVQSSQSGDQTIVLSSRPIRRFTTTNGPTDGKSGVQHLLFNRKFQMVQQRTSTDDDKEVKPKILEGTYLKFPADFNVVSSNNLSTINASVVTSKHNYSLPPQATFHPQPITLINQSGQTQNKVIMSHTPQTNLTLSAPVQDMQNKITIPTSNIKFNIMPSLAQVVQSGASLVIDTKNLTSGGSDHKATILTTTSSSSSVPSTGQIQFQQTAQQSQQPKVKLEKSMNMVYDSERNRVIYTNLPNKRGGTQFLAQINPKMVNLLPIQQKNNVTGTVQGIVTPSGMLNKSLSRVVTSTNQQTSGQQHLTSALRTSGATIINTSGTAISAANANLLNSSNIGSGNTALIIGTSTGSASQIIGNANDMSATLNNTGTINAQSITNNLTTNDKLNKPDAAATHSGININATSR